MWWELHLCSLCEEYIWQVCGNYALGTQKYEKDVKQAYLICQPGLEYLSLFSFFQVKEYSQKIELYQQQILNLTIRVQQVESGGVSYTELDFQLLKVEINDLERLVTQLKPSLIGSSAIVEQIYLEVLPRS